MAERVGLDEVPPVLRDPIPRFALGVGGVEQVSEAVPFGVGQLVELPGLVGRL
jgi:hypothetical protein